MIALYGIGFGMLGILIGLFVGPQILLASAVHLVLGFAYVIAAIGIHDQRIWGLWLATTCSAIIVGLGLVAITQSLSPFNIENVIVWACISAFFGCLTIIAFREARSFETGRTRQSP